MVLHGHIDIECVSVADVKIQHSLVSDFYSQKVNKNLQVSSDRELKHLLSFTIMDKDMKCIACLQHPDDKAVEVEDLTYHKFPPNTDQRLRWESKLTEQYPSIVFENASMLCSLHFKIDDILGSWLKNTTEPQLFGSPGLLVACRDTQRCAMEVDDYGNSSSGTSIYEIEPSTSENNQKRPFADNDDMGSRPAKASRIQAEDFTMDDMHHPILAKQLLKIAQENEEKGRTQIAALQLCMETKAKRSAPQKENLNEGLPEATPSNETLNTNDSVSVKPNRLKTKRKNHPCPICSMVLDTSKHLLTHMKGFHSHYLKPTCQICGIHFDGIKFYTQHMLAHHQTDTTPRPVNEQTSYADKQMLRELVDRLETLNWCECHTCLTYCRKFFMHLTDAHANNEVISIPVIEINDDDEEEKHQELAIPIFDPAAKDGDGATPRQLTLKVKKDGNSRIYGCPLCDKEFKYPAIVEHIRSHSDSIEPATLTQGKTIMDQEAITIDSDEDDQAVDVLLPHCDVTTDSELAQLSEALIADNGQQKDKSNSISIESESEADEEDPLNLFAVADAGKRLVPGKKSKTKKVHFKVKINGKQTIYTCTYCGLKLTENKALKAHLSVHSKKTTKNEADTQTKDIDGKILEYECSLCGAIKNKRADAVHCLKWHKDNGWYDAHTNDASNSHSGGVRLVYKCKVCKKVFTKQQQSLRHLHDKHFCFLSRYLTKRRIVVNTDGSVHEVKGDFRYNYTNCIIDLYQCECKQTYSSESLADRCMNIHTGIRQHVCLEMVEKVIGGGATTCNLRFYTQIDLESHMKRNHSDVIVVG